MYRLRAQSACTVVFAAFVTICGQTETTGSGGGQSGGLSTAASETASDGRGTLHIRAYPPQSVVFVDGRRVGRGTAIVEDLGVGQHQVDIVNGRDGDSARVFVREDVVTRLDLTAGRLQHVATALGFAHLWVRGEQCFGPLIELSVEHRRSYYGLSFAFAQMASIVTTEHRRYEEYEDNYYDWVGYTEKYGNALVWTAHWLYEVVSVRDVLRIAPGPAIGFIYGPNTSYHPNLVNAGGLLKIMVGRGRVFAHLDYGILAGSSFNHLLYYGFQYHF